MMTTQPLNALILYSVVSPGVRKCVGSQPCFDYFPLLLDVLCLQRAYWAIYLVKGPRLIKSRRIQYRRRQPKADYDPGYFRLEVQTPTSEVVEKQNFLISSRNPFLSKQISLNGIIKFQALK